MDPPSAIARMLLGDVSVQFGMAAAILERQDTSSRKRDSKVFALSPHSQSIAVQFGAARFKPPTD